MKVRVPEQLGRRMSIGPFPDPRDFLRFLLFASVGALVSIALGIPWGLVIVGAGALLTLVRSDEETIFTHVGRRLAYYLSGPSAPGVEGRFTSSGWMDPYGREWRFYARDPIRIHGRTQGEIQGASLNLVRTLAEIEGEAILIRMSEPWDIAPHLPPLMGRVADDRVQYRRLLQDAVQDLYRARLVLGFTVPRKAGSGQTLGEGSAGWQPLTGRDLVRTFRRGLPFPAVGMGPGRETSGAHR